MDLNHFIEKWRNSGASERANKDSFLVDLCDVLTVPHPDPATGDSERDRYVFERDAVLIHGGERHTVGKIDLYKHGCFILEAKQGSERDSKKLGTARRGTAAWNVAMQEAYGQALQYASTIEPPPPFLIITDIGYCFDLYASFDGSRRYRKFPDALSARINIERLNDPANLETLKTIFTDPHALDPAKRAARVTQEIAAHLANLANSIGSAGHAPEVVAKFLMRCLFTMFAEDVELLPKGIFANALNDRWTEHPESFPGEVEELWRRMNEGGYLFGTGKIWRFNGGLFDDPIALPLTKQQLFILRLAAASNWSDVEPAIFGTLLERALDPKERQRFGAHYTPRSYVERLVMPTVEEPLREEWDRVRAQVVAMISAADPDKNVKVVAEARRIVYDFYERLTKIRVLDPACGSGNFLYVALDVFKRVENEVIELLESLGNDRAIVTFGRMVTPQQFHGIEVKEWAKEITELVLWIGWLQWQTRTRGWKSNPEEPILQNYHNIELRDAVLEYDQVEPVLDENGDAVTRWDGETTKRHAVTGEEVPDETVRTPVMRYVNPRPPKWPDADFIVGNPPFVGGWRLRQNFGDGYVAALWSTYPQVSEKSDYVMYWWVRAAELVRAGAIRRFGFITTNSIGQTFQRRVLQQHLDAGGSIAWAITDHPWVDTATGAAVRIAMTVGVADREEGRLLTVISEEGDASGEAVVSFSERTGFINSNLTIGANVAGVVPLKSNDGLASPGIQLYGAGFIVGDAERRRLASDGSIAIIKPFVNGKDLARESRNAYVIDTYGLDVDALREQYPNVYQRLLLTVKPSRDSNRRAPIRDNWWRHGWERPTLRNALARLTRYVVTPETSKHRFFVFLPTSTLPDNMLTAFMTDDAYVLGVLSSRIHVAWALAAGGTLEDRPRYTKSSCFEPFPFPASSDEQKARIRDAAESLDAHRKRQQSLHSDLTLTGIYNVMEKLCSGEELKPKEMKIHDKGLVSTLKQLHEEVDAAVADAYGWSNELSSDEIVERVVYLNAERADRERDGEVLWVAPDEQRRALATPVVAKQTAIELDVDSEGTPDAAARSHVWPKELPRQIAAVRDLISAQHGRISWTAEETAKSFVGGRKKDVEPVLDSLAAVGLLIAFDTPAGRRWRAWR